VTPAERQALADGLCRIATALVGLGEALRRAGLDLAIASQLPPKPGPHLHPANRTGTR